MAPLQDFGVELRHACSPIADGTLQFEGVQRHVPRSRTGATSPYAAQRATVANNQNDVTIEGDVHLTTSDGLTVDPTARTYQNGDGMVRIPGPVTFEKQRLKGQGVGATYDRSRDVLWLLKDAQINVVADPETGDGAVEVIAGYGGLRATGSLHALRGRRRSSCATKRCSEADARVAYLAADEDRLEMLELRGRLARDARPLSQPGGLRGDARRATST